jgi:haloalkane dehalogenase
MNRDPIAERVPTSMYPWKGHFLELDGGRLHYLDEGAGDPIVMVHGNPTWSFYYRELVRTLSDRHRTIVPDHIGCGRSDTPGDDRYRYTLSRRVDDLTALIDHLQLERPVTLVVHDWGGVIGTAWAVRHAERVGRLVILNTAAFHLPEDKRLPWQLWLVRNTPIGAFLVRGFNAFARGATHVACTRRTMPPDVRDAYCAPYDSWHERIATLRFVQDIPLGPSDPAYAVLDEVASNLGRLRHVPAMICWGEKDFVFDHHFLAEWQRRLPAAEVHRFPDAGHYVLEDASEEISELVEQFLAAHPLPDVEERGA